MPSSFSYYYVASVSQLGLNSGPWSSRLFPSSSSGTRTFSTSPPPIAPLLDFTASPCVPSLKLLLGPWEPPWRPRFVSLKQGPFQPEETGRHEQR